MRLVAESEGVNIYCPAQGKFSFFNSPYPAHHTFASIDIYPKRNFGEAAPSPVSGEVVTVRQVRCPEGKGFKESNHDCVVLLRSLENPERWVKMLHVEPTVGLGEVIRPGEEIGMLLRSGYFDFWTEPHIHIEVRKPSDPLRARGSFRLQRLVSLDATEVLKKLSGTVIESRADYALIALDESLGHGIPVDVAGQVGLLDAGIPHYGWAGIHLSGLPPSEGLVRLCGREIGTVESTHSNMCLARCHSPTFILSGEKVGLSFYLFASPEPSVKIVPRRPGALVLRESEEVSVRIV